MKELNEIKARTQILIDVKLDSIRSHYEVVRSYPEDRSYFNKRVSECKVFIDDIKFLGLISYSQYANYINLLDSYTF